MIRKGERKMKTEKAGKAYPDLFNNKENCCGCSACYAICPMHAIKMKFDKEGFLYPAVDTEKCVCCYKCLNVCAFKADQTEKGYVVVK